MTIIWTGITGSYDPDHEIMVTIGGSEAIDAAMRAMLDPGDEVLIPAAELRVLRAVCRARQMGRSGDH